MYKFCMVNARTNQIKLSCKADRKHNKGQCKYARPAVTASLAKAIPNAFQKAYRPHVPASTCGISDNLHQCAF